MVAAKTTTRKRIQSMLEEFLELVAAKTHKEEDSKHVGRVSGASSSQNHYHKEEDSKHVGRVLAVSSSQKLFQQALRILKACMEEFLELVATRNHLRNRLQIMFLIVVLAASSSQNS